jgi:ribonuclease Y
MNTAIAGVVILLSVLTYVAILVVGFLSFQKMRLKAKKIVDEAQEESKRVLELAKREAEELKSKAILESKEEANRYREEIEKDLRNIRRDLQAFERKLLSREENIERKESYLQRKERELAIKERELNDLQKKLEEERERLMQELEKIAGMTKEDARNLLVESIKKETEISALNLVKKIEEEYNQKAVEKARKIIVDAIQRIALDVVNETVISSVQLPNDAMKGRIIGREGRNIRAFETITGVDLIIDDTPGVVVLSSFDPIRRELAKRALIKLVDDGRIHPATIEEVYEKVRNEFEEEIYKIGEETYNDLGLQPMSNEEYKYVGRLKFKVSYSQNVLAHSIETAIIAARIAEELGLDYNTVS